MQTFEQPSPLTKLLSSHSSLPSTIPLPQLLEALTKSQERLFEAYDEISVVNVGINSSLVFPVPNCPLSFNPQHKIRVSFNLVPQVS